MIKVTRDAEVAIVVGPEDVFPRVAAGQVWRFGRRLEVGIDQVIRGGDAGDAGGDDLVYFGPLDGCGKIKFQFRLGATRFLALAARFGGRLRDRD